MISNVFIEEGAEVSDHASLNNCIIRKGTKISRDVVAFGSAKEPLKIGENSYVGMGCLLQGFSSKLTIGNNTSLAPRCQVLSDSGPNASLKLQKIYPIIKGDVLIGNDCWIGSLSVIMPGVLIPDFTIIGANSLVKHSLESFTINAGNPSRIIKKFKFKDLN